MEQRKKVRGDAARRLSVKTASPSLSTAPRHWLGRAPFAGALVACALLGQGAQQEARADEYGCRVLLCLANPNGPRAVEECRPPIDRFLRERARPRRPAPPRCEEARTSSSSAHFQLTARPYANCPEGFNTVASGEVAELSDAGYATYVAQVQAVGYMPSDGEMPERSWVGIGEGLDVQHMIGDGAVPPQKVCARGLVGTRTDSQHSGGDSTHFSRTVNVYNEIIRLDHGFREYADVYINGALFRSTGLN